jgi:hypothetical protein
MKNKFLLIALLLFSFSVVSKADSPLTSTDLATAYANESIMKTAESANGKLNNELMKYLCNSSNPIAIKLAVINKLGWDFNGKINAEIFWSYLQKNNKYKNLSDFEKKGSADLLICYAYIKALDNYFDVNEALKFAKLAIKKDKKKRYSVHIVAALIEAQKLFDSSWCDVWKSTDKVRQNKKLAKDLKEEVITNIFEYMDLYKDDCK